jgi:hypothetical protein
MSCSICASSNVEAINKDLKAGESWRGVATKYAASRSSVRRHASSCLRLKRSASAEARALVLAKRERLAGDLERALESAKEARRLAATKYEARERELRQRAREKYSDLDPDAVEMKTQELLGSAAAKKWSGLDELGVCDRQIVKILALISNNRPPLPRGEVIVDGRARPNFRKGGTKAQLSTIWPDDMVGMEALKDVGNSEGRYPDHPGPARDEDGNEILYFRWKIEWVKWGANQLEARSATVADGEADAEAPASDGDADAEPGEVLN